MEEKKERALLVGLNITSTARRVDDIDINESMDELKELAKAAGAEVVGVTAVIEKGFQSGAERLRNMGCRVESLVVIKGFEDGQVIFE